MATESHQDTPLHIPTLHLTITQSKDKLCFISYTPTGTMLRRWFLVQLCLNATSTIKPDYLTTGQYYAYFLAKHKDDAQLSDENSRWWPDWYRYTKDRITGDIVYGNRILFRPDISPDYSKYIQWADTISISVDGTLLVGPFNFAAIRPSNQTRRRVDQKYWKLVADICITRNLLPPTLGSPLRFNAQPDIN